MKKARKGNRCTVTTEVLPGEIDCLTLSPAPGNPTSTPCGARLYWEVCQIYEQIGEEVFKIEHAELRDIGLQYSKTLKKKVYKSYWTLSRDRCSCQHKTTGESFCLLAIQLKDNIKRYCKAISKAS